MRQARPVGQCPPLGRHPVELFEPWLSQEKLGFGPVGSDEQAVVIKAAATTAAKANGRE